MAQTKKILLIDDDVDLREALSELLIMTDDFDVFEGGDGAEALEKIKQQAYDMVVLDVGLPDIDGRTLVIRLKKQLGGKSAPPIVAVTARSGQSEEYIAKRFGCDAFISKPIDPPAFLQVVKHMMNTSEKEADK